MAEIRLTWWREVLDQIFDGRAVRRHPVAEALADGVRRHSLSREPLEAMIDGQIAVLELAQLDAAAAVAWADAVQGRLAGVTSAVLDPLSSQPAAVLAGQAWGLALLRRSGRAPDDIVIPLLRRSLSEARSLVKGMSVAALPAALPARLARFDLASRDPGPLARRLALVLASATGRI
jgi:phytoene synthase